jgi:hypothetical protein
VNSRAARTIAAITARLPAIEARGAGRRTGESLALHGPANIVTNFSQRFFLRLYKIALLFSPRFVNIPPCVIGDVFGLVEQKSEGLTLLPAL